MIVDHYFQLLIYYRRLVVWTVLSILSAAVGLSTAILLVFPFYTATATVAILPTEAELAYTRGMGGEGQASPTTMMPAIHIEYLLSRPVAERVLEKVKSQLDKEPPIEGWRLVVKDAVNNVMLYAWMAYKTLNSGKFIEPTPYEQALNRLMEGIDLELIENSYILQIEVTLPMSSRASALAANALAEAYVERVNEQTRSAAQLLIEYVDGEIAVRSARYSELQQREFVLRQEAGILSLEQERQSLLEARTLEQERLLEIRIEREELEARLKAYEDDRTGLQRSGTLALVEEEIALSDARLNALARREALRQQSVEQINRDLVALNERKNPIDEVQREINRVGNEIDSLKERRIGLSLSQSNALSIVRVVNPAVEPVYPSFPQVLVNTAIAALAAVFIVIFILVAADTLPGTLKTSADLQRLAGNRALGRLPRGIAKAFAPSASSDEARLRAELKRTGQQLESRLAGIGLFEASTVLVTGFGSVDKVCHAALGLAAAIAAIGERVCWQPPEGWDDEDPDRLARFGILTAGSEVDGGTGGAITFKCIGPVSSRFAWGKIVDQSAPLVCLLGDGELTEEDVAAFRDEAEQRGVPTLAFVMSAS